MYNAIWFTHDYSRDRINTMRRFLDRPTPERDENAKKMMAELRKLKAEKEREKLNQVSEENKEETPDIN